MVITMMVLRMLRLQLGGEQRVRGMQIPVAGAAGGPTTSPWTDCPGHTGQTSHGQHLHLLVGVWRGAALAAMSHFSTCAESHCSRDKSSSKDHGTRCAHALGPPPHGRKTEVHVSCRLCESPSRVKLQLPTVKICLLSRGFLANFLPFFTSPFPFQIFLVSLPK